MNIKAQNKRNKKNNNNETIEQNINALRERERETGKHKRETPKGTNKELMTTELDQKRHDTRLKF